MVPEVIGFHLDGKMPEGTTATDLVLVIVQMLREKGVVGKFVEFYGPGLDNLTLEGSGDNRQHGSRNMVQHAVSSQSTMTQFLICRHPVVMRIALRLSKHMLKLRVCGAPQIQQIRYSPSTLSLELKDVVPSIAGPKRPQDRIALSEADKGFASSMAGEFKNSEGKGRVSVKDRNHDLGNGDVVIAAITSCTNTSNPSVLIGAGLLARKAREKGLSVKPWVKTSLAPGSQVVTDYLDKAGLTPDLDALGFNLVGYGCTTCIGNSGTIAGRNLRGNQYERSRSLLCSIWKPELRGSG